MVPLLHATVHSHAPFIHSAAHTWEGEIQLSPLRVLFYVQFQVMEQLRKEENYKTDRKGGKKDGIEED